MAPKITLREFLDRAMAPELVISGYCSDSQTTTPSHPRTDLARLEIWNDFPNPTMALSRYLDEIRVVAPVTSHDKYDLGVQCELNIQASADRFVYRPIMRLLDAIGMPLYFLDIPGNKDVIGNPDRIVTRDLQTQKPILVLEYKSWWACPMEKLYKDYEDKVTKATKVIHQIYGYMSFNYLRYGVISNYNDTYFFRRKGPPESAVLQMYGPVKRTARGLDSLFAHYLVLLLQLRESHWFHSSPSSSPAPERFYRISIDNQFLQFKEGIARSRSLVCRGLYGNRRHREVIIKSADLTSDKAQELENEIKIYELLRPLQGKVIPEFITSGTIWGLLKVIVLQPFGDRLDGGLDHQTRSEMRGLISQLHSLGVLHGDVALRNFLRGPDGALKIVDFAFSKVNPTEDEMRREMDEIDQLDAA